MPRNSSKAKSVYKLTDADYEIIELGKKDPNYITDYYFRTPESGTRWVRTPEPFDENKVRVWNYQYEEWKRKGRPDRIFVFNDVEYKILWDSDGFPIFHHNHGWIFQDWQKEWFLCEKPEVTVIGGMGVGKAQPLTAKILTPNGWSTMGDMKAGSEIIGSDGKSHNVTGVYPRGIMPVYKVTFSDGSSTECSLDHLWKTRNNKNKEKILPLSYIKDSIRNKFGNHNYFVPIISSIEFSKKDLPLDPYFFGLILGDGNISRNEVRFSSADEYILDYIRNYITNEYELVYMENYDYKIKKLDGKKGHIYTKGFRDLNLIGTKSDSKFIPEIYKLSSIEDRLALLQGLLDTDGSPNKGSSIEYYTVSKILCEDVVFLVESLGGTATVSRKQGFYYKDDIKINGKLGYRLYIKLPKDIDPFRLPRKIEIYKSYNRQRKVYRAIESIEYIRDDFVQCIMVDTLDHLYVTDDMILTHNTGAFSTILAVRTLIYPHYRGFAIAPLLNQSMEVYKYIMMNFRNTIWFQRFVHKNPTRPYPMFSIRSDYVDESTIEILSVEKDPEKVRTLEGDEVFLDQSEKITELDDMILNIGTRARGAIDGRAKLGRLHIIANAGDNPELWQRFDMEQWEPEIYKNFNPATWQNIYLSTTDISNLKRRVGGEVADIDQWMSGQRPMGSGEHFPPDMVRDCTDNGLNNIMEEAQKVIHEARTIEENSKGHIKMNYESMKEYKFVKKSTQKAGIVHFEMPPELDLLRKYITIGDPGQGNPPDRNSGCVMTWDITNFPEEAAVLRCFAWIYGNGSYWPFFNEYERQVKLYKTQGRNGFDSTGVQKGFDELYFAMQSIRAEGLNMANQGKFHTLNAAKLFMGKRLMRFPYISHLSAQLTNYKQPDTNIRQDLVMTLAMSAMYMRRYYWEVPYDHDPEDKKQVQVTIDRRDRPIKSRNRRFGKHIKSQD